MSEKTLAAKLIPIPRPKFIHIKGQWVWACTACPGKLATVTSEPSGLKLPAQYSLHKHADYPEGVYRAQGGNRPPQRSTGNKNLRTQSEQIAGAAREGKGTFTHKDATYSSATIEDKEREAGFPDELLLIAQNLKRLAADNRFLTTILKKDDLPAIVACPNCKRFFRIPSIRSAVA